MQPLTPIDRPIAALPVRSGSGIADAFAQLLERIGKSGGEGGGEEATTERQPPAPPGKRLPGTTIDPALLLPPMVVQPVDAPPLAPPPEGARAVAVPVAPAEAALPDDIMAQIERVAVDPTRPVVAEPLGNDTPGVLPPPDPSGATRQEAALPAEGAPPVVRRPMPGEHRAPVVALAPPRPLEAVVVALAEESGHDDPREAPAIDRPGEAQPVLSAAEPIPRPVAAPGAADGARLDTRDDRWMQGMIDYIETLRDAGGAMTGTRIRLSPDALGSIEVVLHRTDDGVAVRFAGDNADAVRLLTDAQPRLADLAQARGVRLAGMGVDVGGGHGSQHRSDPDAAPRRARPVPAATPADPATDDIRIA